ncbi:MAG: hypothetical protein VKN56_13315 [Cyanobacteriota bacterium]|nr:hypothetical protein [Cyanobacteriota bacterium]
MDLERFCLKFLARQGQVTVDEASFIPIFHDWIRLKTLPGTLIDVADYRHVPEGPGIMLISHEINYAMEHGDGQFGLSAQRKLGEGATHQERILALAKRLALFGSLLETDERLAGQLKLEGGAFLYKANDRLLAPNTDEAFAALQPDLQAAASQLYGGATVTVTRLEQDPRDRLTALVEVAGPVELAALV